MKKFLIPFLFLISTFTLSAQAFMTPITLRVDINQLEGVGINTHISVSSNVMSWSSTPMDDSDGDGIYEKTIYVGSAAGQETEFLYAFQLQTSVGMLIKMMYEGSEINECLYNGSDDGYGGFGKVRKLLVPSQIPSDFIVSTCWDECTSICEPDPIPGCIDPSALNYNEEANTDDGSCIIDAVLVSAQDIYGVHGECADVWNVSTPEIIADAVCLDNGYDQHVYFDINSNETGFPFSGTWNLFYNTNASNADDLLTGGVQYGYSNGSKACDDLRGVYNVYCEFNDVYGCTDSLASNYNEEATINDESCEYPIEGCLDVNADNYNVEATIQGFDQYGNFQCIYTSCDDVPDYGCMYTDGFGLFNEFFDAAACLSYNGIPCEEPINGCTDPLAANFVPEATLDDGSCEYPVEGCTDPLALNFDPEANVNNNSCEYPVEGCTDPEAINYNPLAEVDNGTCSTATCSNGEVKMLLEITLDDYPGETGWILTDISTGQPIASVAADEYSFNQANTTIPYQLCVPSSGVELILSDSYGDGMNSEEWGGTNGNFVIMGDLEPCGSPDVIWELPDVDFGSAAYSGPIFLEECEIESVYGCTDRNYQEFDFKADVDDGSCVTPHIVGCIDYNAFNYNPEATLNYIVPECEYTLIIKDNGGDGWGESYITVAQGDSIIGTYTMGPGSYQEEFQIKLQTNKSVDVYYFELGKAQQPQQEIEFQTMHNSFELYNANDVFLVEGGTNPFSNNGQGALQPFHPPFWHVYSAMPYCGDYCIDTVEGCMDENAFNFNPEANTDDGSCIEKVFGCTNDLAFNYDKNANVDDDSCQGYVYGCMDPIAWNYNEEANVDNESCIYFGCTDPVALNFDPGANVDNDVCVYPIFGCMDKKAFNYNELANVEDGSCEPVIIGCTDSTMLNFKPSANTDAGNCVPFIYGCTDKEAFNFDLEANTDDGSCEAEVIGCMDETAFNYNALANIDAGNCEPFVYGCMNKEAFNFNPLANTDDSTCEDKKSGCTDPSAFNFDPDANIEDYSCIERVFGCINELSFNYDSLANTNDGSCIGIFKGCTDFGAYNFDFSANVDDGSCLYDAGCFGEPGNPYWLNDECYAWVITVDSYCCTNEWDTYCQVQYDYCDEEYSVGLDDLSESEIAFYPNPTTGVVNILAKNDIKIDITNILGKTIAVIENENRIDLSRFSNGIYIFNITYNNSTIQYKVIKK
jgi:hypothetical protein